MPGRRIAVVLLLLAAVGPGVVRAQAAPITEAQSRDKLVAERDVLIQQANAAAASRDFAAAAGFAERALAIERALFGDVDQTIFFSLEFLVGIHEDAGQLGAAERRALEMLDVATKLFNAEHWRVTDVRLRLAHLRRRRALSPEDDALYRQIDARHRDAYELGQQGRYRQAIAMTEENIRICMKLLGASDITTVSMLSNLGYLFGRIGEYPRARPLLEQALATRLSTMGEEHPSTARSRNNLGEALMFLGQYREAEELFLRALQTVRAALGDDAPETIASLNNLGFLYNEIGNVDLAEQTLRQSLALRRRRFGDSHPSTGIGLSNLARLYADIGDHARAQSLYEEALSIYRGSYGTEHPETASVMVSLASMYGLLNDAEQAGTLFNEALAVQRRVLGEDHPSVAITLNNLALLYLDSKQPHRAVPLFEQAVAVRRRAFGDRHPEVAATMNNAATAYIAINDHARARKLLEEAVHIQRSSLPARHPDLARTLHALGVLASTEARFAEAEPFLRESLDIALWNLDVSSGAQSERQLLMATSNARAHLQDYLLLAERDAVTPADAWQRTIGWKGRAMARQLAARLASRNPETRAILENLQAVSSELSQLALREPEQAAAADAATRRIAELTDQREQLERGLARAAAGSAMGPVTAAAVRASIPEGSVLIDCFESVDHFIVFIVRREGTIQRVTLGSVGEIADAIERWRLLAKSGIDTTGTGRRLRALLWDPVARHLRDREVVLLSPDGVLGSVPFGALPGQAAGTFLVQERGVVMLPAPAMLPALVARTRSAGVSEGILLVGNVDYGREKETAVPESAAKRLRAPRDAGTAFEPLPGTSREIASILQIQKGRGDAAATVLTGADASEGAVRVQVPRHAYLHFATHGFFASLRFRSALMRQGSGSAATSIEQTIAGYNPDLLSGLVFAGANNPASDDDGILTAAEVASMDLSDVRLAVLSACDTGMGLSAGGEGLLGLQRAFQAAGAETVIATLWSVDDEATRMFMERFYANLWTKRMGRLEALREAQLWMLGEGRPPFFWAAFTLSGDWR